MKIVASCLLSLSFLISSHTNSASPNRDPGVPSSALLAETKISLRLKSTLKRTGKEPIAIILNRSAKVLAVATWDNKTELWNTERGELIATIRGRVFQPYSYSDFAPIDAFSPDGRMLVTIDGKEADLWDAASGRLEHVLTKSDELSWVVFSPDGRTLAIGGRFGSVSLWNTETGKLKHAITAYRIKQYPRWRIISRFFQLSTDVRVSFSPDGKNLLTILYEQPAKVWDTETGRLENNLGERVFAAKFSPSGRYVLTRSLDEAKLWETATGQLKAQFKSAAPEFSPDEHWLGLVEYGGKKGLLNLNAMDVEIPLSLNINDFSTWTSFSPNNRFFVEASGLYGHSAALVDVSSGKVIADIPIKAKKGFDFISDYLKYWEKLSFHPGSQILMGSNREIVRFWDSKSGTEIAQFPEAREPAEFSFDGKMLATTSQDKKNIALWEVDLTEK